MKNAEMFEITFIIAIMSPTFIHIFITSLPK